MLLCFAFLARAEAPELDTFRPSPLAALGATDGLWSGEPGEFDVGLYFQNDQRAWTLDNGVPVASRSVLTPAFAAHVGFGVAFEAALPIVLEDQGFDPDSNLPWEGAAVGRGYARVRLAHSFGGLRLGIGLRGEMPRTELQASLAGGFLVAPDATVLYERGPVLVAVSAAARTDWLNLRGGFAVGVPKASVFLESETQGPNTAVMSELRAGARARFGPVGVEAGVGTGLLIQPGQPSTRMWGAITVQRRNPVRTPPAGVVPTPTPPEVREVDLTLPIQLPGLFLSGGVRLAEDGSERISAVAEYLENKPNLRIRIEAHMAAVAGVDDFTVSQVRADRVRQALIERGIEAGRIEAIGFGSGVYNEDIIEVVQGD